MADRVSSTYEAIAFEEARSIKRRRRYRVWLPIAVVVVMLVALIGISTYSFQIMRADALTLSRGVIANLQARIETEVAAYLRPIPGIIRFARDLLADPELISVRRELAEKTALGILNNAPQLSSLFIGNPAGEFFMVRRYRDGEQHGLETKWIRRPDGASGEPLVRLTRRGPDGELVSDREVPWDGYDPRLRPWYIGAAEHKALYWTDVYPFFSDKAPGITGALPYLDPGGNLVAVVGADVKLESLSEFLGTLSIGKTGLALIVDDSGRVIADPQTRLLTQATGGTARLTRVEDLDDGAVSRAFDRYRVEGHGRRDFEFGGRRYLSASSSLSHLLAHAWSVLVVVPEDDFVGFVAGNVRKTLVLGLALIALAGALAGLAVRQGLRADRDAMAILERQSQLDAQGEAFGTLAAQPALFESGQAHALAPVTEAVARAAHARRTSLWQLDPQGEVLTCSDCFDRETEGHTQGTVLRRSDHPGLFEMLEAGSAVSEVETARDARLLSLHRRYLSPLGCETLLSTPIVAGGRVTGALWLEDGNRNAWPSQVERFAQGIANLIAIRTAAGKTAPLPAPLPISTKPDAGVAPARAPRLPAEGRDIDPGLAVRRATAFRARFAETAGARSIGQLAVCALRFTDALALAEPVGGAADETTAAYLVAKLEAAAAAHGIGYVKFLGDEVVAAFDPDEDADRGVARLADFALAMQATCEAVFAERHAPLAFRMGLDLGPAFGSLIGRERRSFNLWGEAVATAHTMAVSALPGAIQVTETVYHALNDEYLFQLRGRHYLEGIGEFSTYLLGGRL